VKVKKVQGRNAMKKILVLAVTFLITGCHEPFLNDHTPPNPPQGIVAVARDNATQLTWYASQESDVVGYKIWVSDRYDGTYAKIGKTVDPTFADNGAKNGVREYYAVSAYDYDGNESDLSKDVVYATPRPEGYGTKLGDYRLSPTIAGYDFSTYSVGKYNDDLTDLYFESINGRYYLDVWQDTEIQDMGYTNSLHDIALAPALGYSPSKSVEAIPGHTYVLWIWDNHYAKVRVKDVTPSRMTFDWAYQVAQASPELKRVAGPNGTRTFHPSASITAK
jgi:hypothetical protein